MMIRLLALLFYVSISISWSLGQELASDRVGVVSWPKTAQALDREITVSTSTLGQLAEELSKQAVPTFLDATALHEVGLDADFKCSTTINAGTVREALNRICIGNDLTFEWNDHFVRLTTFEAAETRPVRRLYRVRPLLTELDTNQPRFFDHQSLIDLIEVMIHCDTWESSGGPSSTVAYQDVLAISTLDRTHLAILQLLKTLDKARKIDGQQASQTPVMRITAVDDPASQMVLGKLDMPVNVKGINESDTIPLNKLVKTLTNVVSVPIWIHNQSLDEAGYSLDLPIRLMRTTLPLRLLLSESLRPHDLTYSIMDRTIVIESIATAEQRPSCVVYPVADLVTPAVCRGHSPIWLEEFLSEPSQLSGFGNSPFRFRLIDGIDRPGDTVPADKVIELVCAMVDPDSWESLGGPGVIAYFEPAHALVVSSTDTVHLKITQLLKNVRRTREPPIQSETLDDIGERFVTVAFELLNDTPRLADAEELVRRAVDPTSWQKPQTSITSSGQLLIVAQSDHDGRTHPPITRETRHAAAQLQAGHARRFFLGRATNAVGFMAGTASRVETADFVAGDPGSSQDR